MTFSPGTLVRNIRNGEIGHVVRSAPDSWGNVPVWWHDEPEGLYWAAPDKLELVEAAVADLQLTECRGDPLLKRRAA